MTTHPSQPGEQKPTLSVYPNAVRLPNLEGVWEVSDTANHLWFAYTQTKGDADKIVAALAAHAQSQARIASLEGALREIADMTGESERDGSHDEWTEAAAFSKAQEIASLALSSTANPESK